jgi:aryl-alcohol dehydrogenase-like predicted oxidoreductase
VKEKLNHVNRRNFLKKMGAVGLTSTFAAAAKAESNTPVKRHKPELPQVPKRKFGKTGIDVPCLSLGTAFDTIQNQIILRKALEWGVSYWDIAHNYSSGDSERGVGKFLSRNPELRKKLFIATKASIFDGALTADKLQKRLEISFERLNTTYIDLYFGAHDLSDPAMLTDELKQWVENAKKQKLIRFFAFSTHKNMTECLTAAAKLEWIDAVMTSYNFRLMQDEKLKAAIDACHKAGIALIAMKTQSHKVESGKDKELTNHFLKRGFTEGQAKVKIVLEDKRFCSACVGVGRSNIAHLMLNIAAVLDKTKLTQTDRDIFKSYAESTCSGYCAGCANICNSALPDTPYISEVMRYLMYYNSYGDTGRAKELFAALPADVRNRLPSANCSTAEAMCPQNLPIGKLVAEAVGKLA